MELPNVFTGILKASPTCARQISCYTAKHGIGIVSYATLVRNCYFTSKRNKLVLTQVHSKTCNYGKYLYYFSHTFFYIVMRIDAKFF